MRVDKVSAGETIESPELLDMDYSMSLGVRDLNSQGEQVCEGYHEP